MRTQAGVGYHKDRASRTNFLHAEQQGKEAEGASLTLKTIKDINRIVSAGTKPSSGTEFRHSFFRGTCLNEIFVGKANLCLFASLLLCVRKKRATILMSRSKFLRFIYLTLGSTFRHSTCELFNLLHPFSLDPQLLKGH